MMSSVLMGLPLLSVSSRQYPQVPYELEACRVVLFSQFPSPHAGAAFEPLQILVRARKSMHTSRDKRDLVWITQDVLRCIAH